MKLLLENLACKLKLDCLSFEEVKKKLQCDNKEYLELRYIGFDLLNNCCKDVKFYFPEKIEEAYSIYAEKSFSILRNKESSLIRQISRHYPKTTNDGREKIKSLFNSEVFELGIESCFIKYGEIIQSYTRSKVYPYFGGGLVYLEDGTVHGVKLYYTLYTYESVESKFGTVNKEGTIQCITDIINLIKVSPENMQKILKLFDIYHDHMVVTLFAVNVSAKREEEYKIYFLLPEETMSERRETVKKIHSLLGNTPENSLIDNIFSMMDECEGYCFCPQEICISVLNDSVSLKAYFKVEY